MSFDPASAREAVSRIARRTPMIAAPQLGEGVWLKLESLQRTGAFKVRGACAALAGYGLEEIVTASAGNHGLGVACAARALGKRATVVVPHTTPAIKREGIAALGAAVHVEGRGYDQAEAAARKLARERGLPFLSPFDDDAVIFGNGTTTGEEIRAQRPDVLQVVAPIGGGGLMAGLAQALGDVALHGVQPAGNCAMAESLRLGHALTVYEGQPTLCEGLEGATSERTFAAVREAGVHVSLVDEDAVRRAIAFAYRTLGLIVEPSAAVGIAALRAGAIALRPPCVVVVTGSNIEPELLEEVLRD